MKVFSWIFPCILVLLCSQLILCQELKADNITTSEKVQTPVVKPDIKETGEDALKNIAVEEPTDIIDKEAIGSMVDPRNCKDSCNSHGQCHGLFTGFPGGDKKNNAIIYKCFCNSRYFGENCEDCAKGFYGSQCMPCKTNPSDGTICGINGICDDGIEGSGKCLCPEKDLEPSLYCESASREFIEEEEETFTLFFFYLLCIMFFSLLVLYLYNKVPFFERFPECMIAVTLGIIVGIYIRFYHPERFNEEFLHLESETYLLIILPPIMFQVGFSMNADTLFKNIAVINTLGIIGTLLSSVFFGAVLYYSLQFTSLSYGIMECIQLGCIISAIDPVATMSIFKNLNLNDKIYMYVFGESTLNNAVAIALCAAFEGNKQMVREEIDLDYFDTVVFSIETFVICLFGSLFIGAAWAIFLSLVIANLELDSIPWIEIGFFTISCYFPYIFCEAVGCSGVLSIFICGLFMRNYAFNSLSVPSQVTIEYMVDTVAFSLENFVFAFFGIAIPNLFDDVNYEHLLAGIASLFFSRVTSIILLCWIMNMFKKKKIPFSHQIALIYCGLRGAVSFYLVLNMTFVKEAWESDSINDEHQKMNITTVMAIISVTVFFTGSTTKMVLDGLHSCFPQDKVFCDPSEVELDNSVMDEDASQDFDYMDHSEKEENSFLKSFLIKKMNLDNYDPLGERFLPDEDPDSERRFPSGIEGQDDGASSNFGRSISFAQTHKHRESIMHQTTIPKQTKKVNFNFDTKKKEDSKRNTFASPESKYSRRATIQSGKINDDLLQRYSILCAGQLFDENIDYSSSRKKSLFRAKSIRDRNERLSISAKRSKSISPGILKNSKMKTVLKKEKSDQDVPSSYGQVNRNFEFNLKSPMSVNREERPFGNIINEEQEEKEEDQEIEIEVRRDHQMNLTMPKGFDQRADKEIEIRRNIDEDLDQDRENV